LVAEKCKTGGIKSLSSNESKLMIEVVVELTEVVDCVEGEWDSVVDELFSLVMGSQFCDDCDDWGVSAMGFNSDVVVVSSAVIIVAVFDPFLLISAFSFVVVAVSFVLILVLLLLLVVVFEVLILAGRLPEVDELLLLLILVFFIGVDGVNVDVDDDSFVLLVLKFLKICLKSVENDFKMRSLTV
jgi:hypothetical protein